MKKGILATVSLLAGAVTGAIAMSKVKKLMTVSETEKIDKFKGYYYMLNRWIVLKQEGKSLEQYFIDNDYKTIAIYGMGEMGNRLYGELKDSDKVQVVYAIDKNSIATYSELDVLEVQDDLPEVDVIVVTATFAFYKIEEELSKKVACPIVSLDNIVSEI